ncbi:mucin-5B-like [Culicoides brevitarsis]|uniref:mucin-5B-like n=1 Tax=Culicoides brevitarsis TaxID=469753 RepID=UPI00307B8C73
MLQTKIFIFFTLFVTIFAKNCTGPFQTWTCSNSCKESCRQGRDIFCPTECTFGYFCQEGFRRHSNGTCIREEFCPCWRPNEQWTDCGSWCGEDCPKYDNTACKGTCEKGCYCKPGFQRFDGVCVPQEKCPKPKCKKPNEKFTRGNFCAEKCFAKVCTRELTLGCFCLAGFSRNEKGDCVKTEFCGKI